MNKRKSSPEQKTCAYCYWFRLHSWHVGTAMPVKINSQWMNRGCTYGWQKRDEVAMPPLEQVMESFIIEGDVLNKPMCSGWRDCGAYDLGVKKGVVVGMDSDKDKYRQWLDEQGIPYEE